MKLNKQIHLTIGVKNNTKNFWKVLIQINLQALKNTRIEIQNQIGQINLISETQKQMMDTG